MMVVAAIVTAIVMMVVMAITVLFYAYWCTTFFHAAMRILCTVLRSIHIAIPCVFDKIHRTTASVIHRAITTPVSAML